MELLQSDSHPFSATVGLRIDPAPLGSGVAFRLDIDPNRIPIFIYKTQKKFREAMTEYVSEAFKAGLRGWEVTDAVVTMTHCDYYIGDGATKATLPTARTTAADFRKLTPNVLREALRTAGTVVCQPMLRVNVETPVDTIGEVFSAAARLGGAVEAQSNRGRLSVIDVLLPAARAQELIAQLPGLTGGEAVTDPSFAGYQPVRGTPPAAAV